jgi:hypothetical protein
MDFSGGLDLADQASVAVDALVNGVARCVTLSTGAAFGWDTHANNDQDQSPLWEICATSTRVPHALPSKRRSLALRGRTCC